MPKPVPSNRKQRSATGRALLVVRALEEEIALGQLRPRERLPEDDLAIRFKAKRHVVRQALVELETMGIVVRQPNKGASVRDFRPDEVENIYLVRELVERRAAELIALPGDPDLIAKLRRVHDGHRAAVEARDLRRVFRENLLFHRTFFAACRVPTLVEVIELFALRAHAIRSYTIGDPDLLRRVCDEHARMIDLLVSGDRAELIQLVTTHIQPAKEAYLKGMPRPRGETRPAAASPSVARAGSVPDGPKPARRKQAGPSGPAPNGLPGLGT